MIHRKKDSKKFIVSGGSSGIFYQNYKNDKQSFALVYSKGLYPEEGYSVNDICTENFYVSKGKIRIELNGIWNSLGEGDVVSVPPGTKYRIDGEAEVIVFITPVWDPEQNHIIKD